MLEMELRAFTETGRIQDLPQLTRARAEKEYLKSSG